MPFSLFDAVGAESSEPATPKQTRKRRPRPDVQRKSSRLAAERKPIETFKPEGFGKKTRQLYSTYSKLSKMSSQIANSDEEDNEDVSLRKKIKLQNPSDLEEEGADEYDQEMTLNDNIQNDSINVTTSHDPSQQMSDNDNDIHSDPSVNQPCDSQDSHSNVSVNMATNDNNHCDTQNINSDLSANMATNDNNHCDTQNINSDLSANMATNDNKPNEDKVVSSNCEQPVQTVNTNDTSNPQLSLTIGSPTIGQLPVPSFLPPNSGFLSVQSQGSVARPLTFPGLEGHVLFAVPLDQIDQTTGMLKTVTKEQGQQGGELVAVFLVL